MQRQLRQRRLWVWLLFAALPAPAAWAETAPPVADEIWTLTILSVTVGPPSSDSYTPPPVPCLPCSIHQPGESVPLVIDVGKSGPVDPDIELTGLYLGAGDLTLDFDLSHDSQLLASYEAGTIAYLVIVNPQFGIEQSQHLTLRYTLRKNGIPYWTEQELLWRAE